MEASITSELGLPSEVCGGETESRVRDGKTREPVQELYALDGVCAHIQAFALKTVVLQFPDDALMHCTAVYYYMEDILGEEYSLFIVADSTFGSSVDDVSAMHVDSSVIVYFGSDLSSSGTIPIMVVPRRKSLEDIGVCSEELKTASPVFGSSAAENPATEDKHIVLVCDPSYYGDVERLCEQCSSLNPNIQMHLGKLPACSNLQQWSPTSSHDASETGPTNTIGGFVMDHDINNISEIWYVGSKREQLASIFLNHSQCPVVVFDPVSDCTAATLYCVIAGACYRY
jgi:diphthamide biosynthesis enzyme Dph1/Dph2-like protein